MHCWLRRTAVVLGIVIGAVFVPGPAVADVDVDRIVELDPATLPVTVDGFVRDPGVEDPCATIRATAGTLAADDVWVFAARDALASSGRIEALTATFVPTASGPDDVTTASGPDDVPTANGPDDVTTARVDGGGRTFVWVGTPPGRTLVAASATVRGAPGRLELAAVCPANTGPANTGSTNTGSTNTGPANTGSTNTGPANTGPANTGPANTANPGPTNAVNPGPTVPTTAAAQPTPAPTAPGVAARSAAGQRRGAVDRLATTGVDVAGMLILGVSLIVAGVLLLIVRRAKPARSSQEEGDRGTAIIVSRPS